MGDHRRWDILDKTHLSADKLHLSVKIYCAFLSFEYCLVSRKIILHFPSNLQRLRVSDSKRATPSSHFLPGDDRLLLLTTTLKLKTTTILIHLVADAGALRVHILQRQLEAGQWSEILHWPLVAVADRGRDHGDHWSSRRCLRSAQQRLLLRSAASTSLHGFQNRC